MFKESLSGISFSVFIFFRGVGVPITWPSSTTNGVELGPVLQRPYVATGGKLLKLNAICKSCISFALLLGKIFQPLICTGNCTVQEELMKNRLRVWRNNLLYRECVARAVS